MIISMFNIVDGEIIYNTIKIPVIIITFKNSQGIDDIIKTHFPTLIKSNYSNKKTW